MASRGFITLVTCFLAVFSSASHGLSPSLSSPTSSLYPTRPYHHKIRSSPRHRNGLVNLIDVMMTSSGYPDASQSPSHPTASASLRSSPASSFTSSPSRAASKTHSSKRSPLTPIYLVVLLPRNDTFLYNIERVSPAIKLATDNVTSSRILPGMRLVTLYADSKCHISVPMNEAIKMYMKGTVHALFGPVCDLSVAAVARQAVYWKVPVITSGAMAGDFLVHRADLYNTLTRVGANYNTLSDFLITLFQMFGYHKINLFYDPEGHSNIIVKLCHVAINGIHESLIKFNKSKYKFTNTASKFIHISEIEKLFLEKVGVHYGGKLQDQVNATWVTEWIAIEKN